MAGIGRISPTTNSPRGIPSQARWSAIRRFLAWWRTLAISSSAVTAGCDPAGANFNLGTARKHSNQAIHAAPIPAATPTSVVLVHPMLLSRSASKQALPAIFLVLNLISAAHRHHVHRSCLSKRRPFPTSTTLSSDGPQAGDQETSSPWLRPPPTKWPMQPSGPASAPTTATAQDPTARPPFACAPTMRPTGSGWSSA